MWLRHALNIIAAICIISACSPSDRHEADKLNSLSYAYHYRSLDSTLYYAYEALALSQHDKSAQAEALNNLAFVNLTRMRYDLAQRQLDSIPKLTDNQLELMIAAVQQMRLCQRRSHNKEFYDYREQALNALNRINEERLWLSPRQQLRLTYAESELAIVTSTYYYYVGLEHQSALELQTVGMDLECDTAQWMNYLYNIGAGGIINEGTQSQIEQQEFQYLIDCYDLAIEYGSLYFQANSLEALAEHLMGEESGLRLTANNPIAMRKLGIEAINKKDLPIILAKKALRLFQEFGDVYQIAGAYRTLASCYREKGDYEQALDYLGMALADTIIQQAPDLVASIREQLSVAFSAVNDKQNSDLNRNIYLDLQEQTRQDRQLEARAGQLDATIERLNMLLILVALALVVTLVSFRIFFLLYKHRQQRKEQTDELEIKRQDLEEQLFVERRKRQLAERRNLEQRAKISLVNSILPLVDRMLHEVRHLNDSTGQKEARLVYLRELTDKVSEQNEVLTRWIKLRQGDLNLHIESFNLEPIFELIRKSSRSFSLAGINLVVEPTVCRVKADRVLTIFMLNTLADNARKFTPKGGSILVSAKEEEHYVEVSVSDTGIGMDQQEQQYVFEHKVKKEHGFGLLNCKGIIEKYKKTSQLFSVCILGVESKKGEGSRFYFRLPKGMIKSILMLSLFPISLSAQQLQPEIESPSIYQQKAVAYSDSAYYSNINGTYERTVCFVDSCLQSLNRYYHQFRSFDNDTLRLYADDTPLIPEIFWLHSNLPLDYNILLSIRNECAIAALALHDWDLYQYNNRIYTTLFKELSADLSLNAYCRRMIQLQSNMMVAIVLLVLIIVALLVILSFQIIQAVGRKAKRQQHRQEELELLSDELHRVEWEESRLHVSNQVLENCLSTLKHETMYYPSRIRQLADSDNLDALPEVASYYREIYGILSAQTGQQIEGQKLTLEPLDHEILGNRNLIDYLFEILRKQISKQSDGKQNGNVQFDVTYSVFDEKYVACTVLMPESCKLDFTATVENIPYLICRQIVREHGEATGRHNCGISIAKENGYSKMIILLPRYVSKT